MAKIQNEHRCGWVALMGPPNAGKSTLLNALLGQKISIVTSKPQTTRSRVVGIMSEPGAQVIFMDTPGVNHSRQQQRGHLSKMMSQAAWQSMAAAHAVMLVLDADLYLRRPEFLERDIQSLRDALADDERPLLVVVNKVDLFHDKSRMLPLLVKLQEYFPKAEVFPMSALTKDGLDELKKIIAGMMPEGASQFPEDQLSTAPTRFLAAEIVREKVFERLRQEVPYTTAVDIESWEEDPERDLTIIHAVIFVQRPSHKAMVIGRAGATIKEIGTDARRDIQKLIGGKVHLQLFVKVKDNWAEDTELLHDLGLEDE
ncbi:GTPase Era [Mailhella massiliensis]|uniref:GTPase Era n=1 Tax=Mailhella massiliensis TaxID=1903261 RepID=A0A921AU74_9BACT|nr:GTPase Era [Mailhella massiliensis]HJD96161.1 GTPase Era [Mailhella massiliensis]